MYGSNSRVCFTVSNTSGLSLMIIATGSRAFIRLESTRREHVALRTAYTHKHITLIVCLHKIIAKKTKYVSKRLSAIVMRVQ